MSQWIHKGAVLLAAIGAQSSIAHAQTPPDPLWLRQFEGRGQVRAAASDVGGAYVAGHTGASLGAPNQGSDDVYVARYDRDGNRAWIRQFGTAQRDHCWGLAPDGKGGVFAGGRSSGNLTGTAPPGSVWLARYDSAGDRLWLIQPWAVTSGLGAMAPDDDGGFFAAGSTTGSIGGPNAGNSDIVVARFDANGNQIWVRQFGSASNEGTHAAAPDGSGGVYLGGETHGHLAAPLVGFIDAWLARYDSSGNRLWLRQWGDANLDRVTALAPDDAGGIFVAGQAGGPGNHIDFIARYNGDGERLWIRHFSTGEEQFPGGLASDGVGGAFITGHTRGNLGGPNAGGGDIYLARYNGAGSLLWITQFGTEENEYGFGAAPDHAGGVYVVGETGGNLGGLYPPPTVPTPFIARFPSGDEPPCYANCTGSATEPILTVDDFTCFINEFALAQSLPHEQQIAHYANCDGSTTAPALTVDDFTCFINAFAAGCP